MSKIKDIPRPKDAIDVTFLKSLNIQSYDSDNLYPQNVLRIVGASRTGSGCLERFKDFVEGDGIASDVLANVRVNRQGETLAELHSLISSDDATFDGFAIHVNYNENGLIVEAHFVPFENARLVEPNEEGIVTKVALHPDWTGQKTWAGKRLKVESAKIDYIDVFNPSPDVVRAQIANAGGITFYKGQILYVSHAGYLRYPLASFNAVLTDMSTDEGISNLMLRNARNNFLPSGAFVHFTSQSLDEDGNVEVEGYSDALRQLQGDTNALAMLDITVESKDEIPQFVPFEGRNIDKDFTSTDSAIKESIYSKFGQEAFLAVRLGKLGFSGTVMQEANDDYARRCVKRQRKLSRAYVDILSHWAIDLGEVPTMQTLDIKPLTYAVKTIENVNEE